MARASFPKARAHQEKEWLKVYVKGVKYIYFCCETMYSSFKIYLVMIFYTPLPTISSTRATNTNISTTEVASATKPGGFLELFVIVIIFFITNSGEANKRFDEST